MTCLVILPCRITSYHLALSYEYHVILQVTTQFYRGSRRGKNLQHRKIILLSSIGDNSSYYLKYQFNLT